MLLDFCQQNPDHKPASKFARKNRCRRRDVQRGAIMYMEVAIRPTFFSKGQPAFKPATKGWLVSLAVRPEKKE
jgi:hypothetical protein